MTDKPKTITVDGITYTRAEEPCPLSLLILHRGFIYVGEIVECHSDALSVKNAANVRKWERGGIGGLTIGAKSSGATLDACAAGCRRRAPTMDDATTRPETLPTAAHGAVTRASTGGAW